MSLTAIANRFYNLNVQRGWYTDPATGQPLKRNPAEMLALMHSEISEFYEAAGVDEKLPAFPARQVELADLYIRTMDFAGYLGLDLDGVIFLDLKRKPSYEGAEFVADAHYAVSQILEAYRKSRPLEISVFRLLLLIKRAGERFSVPLIEVVEAKNAYNAIRADHQMSARQASGGKRI
jgi:NTP pyrophosphatase (non-canonical NTP hydrolase)